MKDPFVRLKWLNLNPFLQGERSSADEGFTSGGSPVGDCGSSSGGSGTGNIRCGRIPVLLSPDSAGDTAHLVSNPRHNNNKKANLVFHSCSSPTSSLVTRCSVDDVKNKNVGAKTPLLAESLSRESTVWKPSILTASCAYYCLNFYSNCPWTYLMNF